MDIIKLFAMIAELAAKAGAGSASLAGCHQPKEPKNINVILNKWIEFEWVGIVGILFKNEKDLFLSI